MIDRARLEARIAAADKDATFLLADVEVVATYKLHNLNRTRLESIFHRLFGAVQLSCAGGKNCYNDR